MIWFFAFTSVGMSLMLFLLLLNQTVRLGWKDALTTIAGLGLMTFFLRG